MPRSRTGRVMLALAVSLTLLLAGSGGAVAGQSVGRTGGTTADRPAPVQRVTGLPGGGTKVFGKQRFLFAYYGFTHPSSTFVLGRTDPDKAFAKMERQGAKLLQGRERLLPVYELVVTIADPEPGDDGDYAHDALHSEVQEYIDAAHRNGALLLLDLQPGRASFLEVAKRWEWALLDPWVGLALDTEWRMKGDQVPGRDIGSVSAGELNRVSAYLSGLARANRLPEKLMLFHQSRTGNVRGIAKVRRPKGVAVVQHVDASGSPATKVDTYDRVARPKTFVTGFMVFLESDSPIMKPKAIRRVDDAIRFVSHQ